MIEKIGVKMVITEKETMFQYLDDLRESGQVNMFGSGAYLQSAFGLSRYEAKDVVLEWMKTFGERKNGNS
jgi:hypothetical protein